MKKFKVGIIGAGSIAQKCHIPGYAKDNECELTAIADVEPKSLEAVKKQWRFQREYHDYHEMLANESLDFVSVCTPNCFHADAAIAALNAGCDVLLEKPIAISQAQGEAIKAAVPKSGKRLGVCFSHRFNDLVRAVRRELTAGLIGQPYMIRVRFAHMGPFPGWASTDWFYNPEMAGGGAMLDMAVHAVDIMQFLIGPITAINAITATLRKPIAVDDNVVACVKIGESCLGYLECGWTSMAGFSGVEVMGDQGAIIADYAQGKVFARSGLTTPDGQLKIEDKVIGEIQNPHWRVQMSELIGQLKQGTKLATSIDDGLSALQVTLAAYEASKTGQRIDL